MELAASLISSFAALLGAIAWPAAFLTALFIFRKPFRELLGRVRKGKVGFVEVELEHVALATERTLDASGAITVEQVHSAARIEARAEDIGETELLRQLDKLCLEYDALRRALPPSNERTRAMTQVLVKMRSVGPSVMDSINVYKGSGSPGSTLAAIAMMQMVPRRGDLNWLLNRFREPQPFIFYHAALALTNIANTTSGHERENVIDVAKRALEIVNEFDGVVDENTVSVLNSIIMADPRL